MGEEAIPEDVRRVIAMHIDSVAQLETLLLLRGEPARDWDAETVADRLYVSDRVAAAVLAQLSASGFLSVSEGPDPRYRYRPTNERLADVVAHLAAAYKKELIAITNLIHAKSTPAPQRLADAFVLRREK